MSLMLHSLELATVARALHARIQQAPEFFSHTPVIVDFSQVPVDASYNFNTLFKVIRQQRLLPVAVRGLPEALSEALQGLGVPVVEQNSPQSPARAESGQLAEPDLILGKPGNTLIIDWPLQSGQRCYARDADLIVVGDCRADNELVADGNIHVYGALRGRALCGLQGNKEARIFCSILEAQMVSVADCSLSPVQVPEALKSESCLQIRLVAGELVISPS